MHLLLAPIDVEGEPRRADRTATQRLLAVFSEGGGQRVKVFRAEVVGCLRSVERVLPWHVPVVPHEPHRVGLARLSEVLIKAPTELASKVSL